jgi:hypothetical protein
VKLNHTVKNTGGFTDARGEVVKKEAHTQYSAVHDFWPVEEFAELTDGPTGCGEVVRVYLLLTSVTRSAVLTEADRRTRPNMLSLY